MRPLQANLLTVPYIDYCKQFTNFCVTNSGSGDGPVSKGQGNNIGEESTNRTHSEPLGNLENRDRVRASTTLQVK